MPQMLYLFSSCSRLPKASRPHIQLLQWLDKTLWVGLCLHTAFVLCSVVEMERTALGQSLSNVRHGWGQRQG